MSKFAIGRIDGGVSITTLISGTIEETIAKWPAEKQEEIVSIREIDPSDISTDRTFRNAWKPDLTVDMPKAREIHKDKLRELRQPILDVLDIAFLRAEEKGDKTEKDIIIAKKQALRDITNDPRIAAAKTPEELKTVIPELLK